MDHKGQALAHLREAMRSLQTTIHAAAEAGNPGQAQRYLRDCRDRLYRADTALMYWGQGDE